MGRVPLDRKSTRLNSSHLVISYAVFCLKKKNNSHDEQTRTNETQFFELLQAPLVTKQESRCVLVPCATLKLVCHGVCNLNLSICVWLTRATDNCSHI